MKWEIIDNSPRRGDIRFVTKFAWLPIRVLSKITNTDHMIWLQLYVEEQVYQRPFDCFEYEWVTISRTIHV
jgi:hypothetical protein